MDECKALRELKRKNEKALIWFIERYGAYVNTIIYNIIGASMSGADIEEISSDVFLTLWINAEKVSHGKAKAYLGGVARNKAKERLRKADIELPLEDDLLLISGEDTEHAFQERELGRFLQRNVLSLSTMRARGFPEKIMIAEGILFCSEKRFEWISSSLFVIMKIKLSKKTKRVLA